MKGLFLMTSLMLLSFGALALGEKASLNIDCCHTGRCSTDIPLCPGVGRNPERRDVFNAKAKISSKSSKTKSQ